MNERNIFWEGVPLGNYRDWDHVLNKEKPVAAIGIKYIEEKEKEERAGGIESESKNSP